MFLTKSNCIVFITLCSPLSSLNPQEMVFKELAFKCPFSLRYEYICAVQCWKKHPSLFISVLDFLFFTPLTFEKCHICTRILHVMSFMLTLGPVFCFCLLYGQQILLTIAMLYFVVLTRMGTSSIGLTIGGSVVHSPRTISRHALVVVAVWSPSLWDMGDTPRCPSCILSMLDS